jgi:deazaflavin-dependent oxidoreductase (nitroreductase family)
VPHDLDEPVTDSPTGWVAKHVGRYVESDGKKGHRWSGVDTLLITTRGRTTGTLRRTALIYGRDRGRFVVVASNGGSKAHPNWYQNLVADPHVFVQVAEERFEALARTATVRQKPRLWRLMVSIWPEYEKYQTRTTREIPVVILERLEDAASK